jgi:hypothetical protein
MNSPDKITVNVGSLDTKSIHHVNKFLTKSHTHTHIYIYEFRFLCFVQKIIYISFNLHSNRVTNYHTAHPDALHLCFSPRQFVLKEKALKNVTEDT